MERRSTQECLQDQCFSFKTEERWQGEMHVSVDTEYLYYFSSEAVNRPKQHKDRCTHTYCMYTSDAVIASAVKMTQLSLFVVKYYFGKNEGHPNTSYLSKNRLIFNALRLKCTSQSKFCMYFHVRACRIYCVLTDDQPD